MTARRLLALAFVLSLGLTLLFGMQALRHSGAFRPAPDTPIEGWMTPRYVGLSWDVPREVVAGALGLDFGEGAGRRSLEALAEERGVPVEALIAGLEAAIAAHRAAAE